MFKNKKANIIDGVEHQGNIPKERGRLLRYIDERSLGFVFFILICFIVIEMAVFFLLYLIFSASVADSINYSIFSVLGGTAEPSVQSAMGINILISIQSIVTNCVISFFMAIVLYKLISIEPELIKMEDHVVFDPETGTLRLRVANASKFTITNAHVVANFRIYIPGSNRHANAKLQLKTDDMVLFRPYVVWTIATKPFNKDGGDDVKLDIDNYDRDRVYKFIPDLLNEKYRSDNEEIAKKTDYRNLDVVITIKSPLFGTDWVYKKSFTAQQFVCGQLKKIEYHDSGEIVSNWSNWGMYDDMSGKYCNECIFAEHCSIIKRNLRDATIK